MPAFVPTIEQKHALDAFAVKYGTLWRDMLGDKWMKGHDTNEPNGHLLRQIRNRCGGPKWLYSYTPEIAKVPVGVGASASQEEGPERGLSFRGGIDAALYY